MERTSPLGLFFHSKRYPRYHPQNEQPAMNERSSMKLNPESTASATTTAAHATNHPELFRDTYWGSFRLAREAEITPAIIANRNRFAEKWRIKARSHAMLPRPTVLGGEDYDHVEQYRDEAGLLVLVCSNYGDGIPPPAILGMRKIPPLYSTDATSYAARYTLTEARARLEAAEGGGPKYGAALFTVPPMPRRSERSRRGQVTA